MNLIFKKLILIVFLGSIVLPRFQHELVVKAGIFFLVFRNEWVSLFYGECALSRVTSA